MPILITPDAWFHRHILNTVPDFNLVLNVNHQFIWQLFNDPTFAFTINGAVVGEVTSGGNDWFSIGLANSVNELDEGLHELRLRVFSASSQETAEMKFYLLVSESADDYVYPNTMAFESIRNVLIDYAQSIFIASEEVPSNITIPDFLVITENIVVGNGRIIKVRPHTFPITPDDQYTGNIVLEFPSFSKTIPVDYKIFGGYDAEYSKPVHFTRDNRELTFYQTTEDKTFLRLEAAIKIYGYDGLVRDEFTIPFDLPFINYRAKINLGQELESYLRLFEKPLPQPNKINAVYPAMEVNLTALELRYSDFTIINEDIIPPQRFLRGRNPISSGNVNSPFWLAFRPSLTRFVSDQSTVILQVFKPAGQIIKKINVFKNDVFLKSIVPGTNGFNFNHAYFLYTAFKMSTVTGILPGDVITFEYEGISQKRNFIINPPRPYSFKIGFGTIWETMDILEFTGPASFETDYLHENSETIRNEVEVSKKIKASGKQKLILNTGWIYRADAYLVDELIKSKKAFLLAEDSFLTETVYTSENYGNIEMVPNSAKIINHESDRNRISFDVEFTINKRHEDEIYSR